MVSGVEMADLILDFQAYSESVFKLILSELDLPSSQRTVKNYSTNNSVITFELLDITVELYLFGEDELI